jgi:DNA-directed RNA polymerase subunit N (RpoN/RPB10)
VKDRIVTASKENEEELLKDTPQMKIFDDLGIERICCRRHFLSQVDILESQSIVKDARQIPE